VNGPFVAIVCSNGSALARIEQAMQPGECFASGLIIDVGVDLQRS
jgi:hypothetical protein